MNPCSSSNVLQTKFFHPSPGLLNILTVGGARGSAFTSKEILEYLKNYILLKKLHNPKNPREVICELDELETVFGVKKFQVPDVGSLVCKNLTQVPNFSPNYRQDLSYLHKPLLKRALEDCYDVVDGKAPRLDNGEACSFTPPSPAACLSGDDSPISVQGYDTVGIDSSPSIDCYIVEHSEYEVELETGSEFSVEYEVASVGSKMDYMTDTDSEIENVILVCEEVVSDREFWADESSEERDNSDSEIEQSDFWECTTCSNKNRPMMRFCEKCWATRTGWIKEKSKERPHPPRRNRKNGIEQMSSIEDSQNSSEPCSSQESLGSSCSICFERPKTATIIHGKTAHQICCYICARKLQDNKEKCPVCRRTIQKVVHNFIV